MKIFSARLRQAREAADLTQAELAALIGAYQTKYQGWEKGRVEPDLETIAKICDVLNISADWLLGRDEKKQPYTSDYEKEVHMLREEAKPYGSDGVKRLRKMLPLIFEPEQKRRQP